MLRPIRATISAVKKVLLVVAVFFVTINLFLYFSSSDRSTKPVNAIQTYQDEIYKTLHDSQYNNSKEGRAFLKIYKLTMCEVIGEACTDNPADGSKNFNKSFIGKLSSMISAPYANPPASGVYWVYTGLQNAGFVPQTYAAEGVGFSAIKPLSNIWKAMRDVAYLLLVIVMVIIGFMVMFRMKLNAQTVISVESALPKIVMSLIYITFSFAIAGFLIDFMYVLIVLGISIIAKADPSINIVQTQNQYLTSNFGTIWDSMFPPNGVLSNAPVVGGMFTLFNLGYAITGILPSWINDSVRLLGLIIWIPGILNFVGNHLNLTKLSEAADNIGVLGISFGKLFGSVAKPIFSLAILFVIFPLIMIYGAGWIIGILILATMLLLLFRIFFMLLTGYLKIILLIVFAPIFMLFEAVPGRHAFAYWFKTLLTELIVFPLVICLLVLGRAIVNLYLSGSLVWQPPFLYGIDSRNFAILLGMGIIFMIPDLVKLAREFMGVKGLPISLQLGTFFAGAGAAGGGALGLMSQFHTVGYALNTLADAKGDNGILKKFGSIFGGGLTKPAADISEGQAVGTGGPGGGGGGH